MQTRAAKRWIDRAIIAVMVAARHRACCCRSCGCSRCRSGRSAEAYKLPPSFLPPSFDFTNYAAVLASRVPFLQIYCELAA